MHISCLSFLFLLECTSAAYQNPTNMLLAAPMLQRNYLSRTRKSKPLSERNGDFIDRFDEGQFRKLQELKMLEASVKETELRQKAIEDEINKIDSELFSLHQQSLDAGIKKKSIQSIGSNTKAKTSQQNIYPVSTEKNSQVEGGKTLLPSLNIPIFGATLSGFATAAGLRKILMSREEKKNENLIISHTNTSVPRIQTQNQTQRNATFHREVGDALKGIDDIEAEALLALQLATEALEKNNVKVVKLKTTTVSQNEIGFSKNYIWPVTPMEKRMILTDTDIKSYIDSELEIVSPQVVSSSGKNTQNIDSIDQNEVAKGIVLKKNISGKLVNFVTAPAFGEVVNDYLVNMANRVTLKAHNIVSDQKIQKRVDIRNLFGLWSDTSLSELDGQPSEHTNNHRMNMEDIHAIDVEVYSDRYIGRRVDAAKDAIRKDVRSGSGVMLFDTRPSFTSRFPDNFYKQAISSVTDKLIDSKVDEVEITNLSQKIEISMHHASRNEADSIDQIGSDISIDISAFVSKDNTYSTMSNQSVVTKDLSTDHSPEVFPTVIEPNRQSEFESSDLDASIDDDLLYPSDVISSHKSQKLKLDIITTGNLFGKPSRTAASHKDLLKKITPSNFGIGSRMKMNVLQFFGLRQKIGVKYRSLFVSSDDNGHVLQRKSLLVSLILFSKVLEQTVQAKGRS